MQPALTDRYMCIVDRDAFVLAAIISSYLFEMECYLPLFMFPPMTAGRTVGDNLQSEVYLSNLLGNGAGVLINNAWARMGGSEYLILAGLSRNQRSYLSVPRGTKIIEVDNLSEVENKFATLALPERRELRCRPAELLRGLFIAQTEQKKLVIDEAAEAVREGTKKKGGVVVVENTGDVGAVIGVNYASSVGANLLVVDPVAKREVHQIQRAFQEWRSSGDDACLERVRDPIRKRTSGASFSEFEYATFFTEGLPYSFVIGNPIPCSYVHVSIKPDLFVFNSIIFEQVGAFRSGVVFSPVFFADEETTWLTEFFRRNHYYLRSLIGADATFAKLDFTAQHFPYGILHICSHGGEVDGWEVSEEFVDRDGNRHVIKYDEVVGYDPVPDKDGRVRVHRKTIFRRFDGFEWMSDELEKQNVPSNVFHDMWQALYRDQRGKMNPNAKRKKTGKIASSCAIRCSDTIHQGELTILASHTSPFIFNNTCWSWNEVAKFFLACGARGYIGTLWNIGNEAAVRGAQVFYENVFAVTVTEALDRALKAIAGTRSKDIYVYWGLHFTTLPSATNDAESRSEVFGELLQAVGGWRRQIQTAPSAEVRTNGVRVLKAVLHELNTNFSPEDLKKLESDLRARTGAPFREADSEDSRENVPIAARSSMEHPVEYERAEKDADMP